MTNESEPAPLWELPAAALEGRRRVVCRACGRPLQGRVARLWGLGDDCRAMLGGRVRPRTRTSAAITAAFCTLLLAGCSSSKPSYDQIADNCTEALAARADGDKVKPKECEGLKPDDYDALLGNEVLRRMGALDKDGKLDPSKLLDPSATP